jgi:hypothetical protein
VVRERAPPVDLHDREQLAVAGFELRVARDVDLLKIERDLVADRSERRPRAVAQVAPGCAVEDDARHERLAAQRPGYG